MTAVAVTGSAAVGVQVPASALAVAPDAATAIASAETVALAAAKRSGSPVEVADSRSELSRVLATPEGSLLLESHATPRWTRGSDGAWRQIDTTLRMTADRGVAPVATLANVAFSTGGSVPAVRLPFVGGSEVNLGWPGQLPAPRLEGDTAVYESVWPEVDLRVRALADGFTWAVVVKSAMAAANPQLQELRMPLSTPGLTARDRTGGGFEVVDGAGLPVLSGGNALMWDSSTNGGSTTRAAKAAAAQQQRNVVRVAPDLAEQAELPTGIEGTDLVIRPDLDLLRGPETVYPVVIDPWTTINKAKWGYTGSENLTRDDGVARVGKEPTGAGTFRSFFRFNLTSLYGKVIRSAKFLTEMTHSWDCANTPVNLWRSADLSTSGKQTWDGPNLALWLEQRSGHAHKPPAAPSCPNDPQPDLPMEFASSNLKDDVAAASGQDNYTLALSTRQSDGTSESTSNWWKKFDPAMTKLTVEYNTNPNTPTAAQMSTHAGYTAPARACVTGTSRPVINAASPWLKATVTDPDGSNGKSLSGVFTVQKWNAATSTWAAATGWPKTDSGVAPGGKAEVQFTVSTADGDRYRWQVQTKDTLGGASGPSPWCEFDIDTSSPETVPAVTTADGLYPASPPLGTNVDAQGGIGYSGRFTFSPNGSTGVYDYVYRLNGGAESTVRAPVLGGSATVWITPEFVGNNVLTVMSRDQAGNPSGALDYNFLVNIASYPKAQWMMDEGTGTSLVSAPVGGGVAATLNNGPTWTDSRISGTHKTGGKDWAVKFDGVNDYASANVGLDTSRSYSIAAWVRPDADGLMEIAGSPASATDSFMLRKWGDNRWTFGVMEENLGATAFTNIFGPVAVTGVWTHVAGVYDAAGGQLLLYVNGTKVSSGTVPRTFNAGGTITIGRERWNGTDVAHWNGAISEVSVWDRVIDPDLDLVPVVAPVKVGAWDMEDIDTEAPRQEGDASGYQRPLTLADAPAADWAYEGGYNGSTGLLVNGSPGSADTAGSVLRTDQSFTVAAWVKVTTADHQTVLSQDGTTRSGFYLMYDEPTDKWCITVPSVDTGTATWQYVMSVNPAQLDTWTHLAARYDASARELKLYVNGVLQGTRADTVTWNSASVFHVGRAKSSFFVTGGTVDRVRAWQGLLSEGDILTDMSEG
ncbi:LamG domain-containing protein [Micromonospora sp. NBC_01655]|uniref:LamG domain-containing protein n=1 Tax=Micromonospora sp. NBC_01655 TaxID=2975983 RepID=UPI00224CF387|nr:LamG domain-containing protein [Micromonospora sp. NBC_01655]MCX4469396.1 LamG domain-containing protein [Micromonospora sp. NBC_01655]